VTVQSYSISEKQTKKNMGSHFMDTPDCVGKMLAPMGTCQFKLTFLPTAAKTTSVGTLSVMSNTVHDLAKINFTGVGE